MNGTFQMPLKIKEKYVTIKGKWVIFLFDAIKIKGGSLVQLIRRKQSPPVVYNRFVINSYLRRKLS